MRPTGGDDRQARLAAALRANLRRRKAPAGQEAPPSQRGEDEAERAGSAPAAPDGQDPA